MPLATLKVAVERLRTLEYRLSEMRAELASEPDVSNFELSLPSLNPRRWNLVGAVLLVAAVLLGLGGVAAGQTTIAVVLGGALLGLAAVAAFVAAVRTRSAQRRLAAAYQLRDAEIARRLRGRSERAEKLREAEREREAVLASTGVADLTAAEALLNAEQEHVGQIETAKAEYRGLFSDKPPKDDVEAVRDAAAAEAEECRHTLAGMGEIGADPKKALAQYRANVERISGEREKALQAEASSSARLDANATDAEQVAADSEALDDAREQLRLAERRVRIWEEDTGRPQRGREGDHEEGCPLPRTGHVQGRGQDHRRPLPPAARSTKSTSRSASSRPSMAIGSACRACRRGRSISCTCAPGWALSGR